MLQIYLMIHVLNDCYIRTLLGSLQGVFFSRGNLFQYWHQSTVLTIVRVCMWIRFNCVWLFAILWTVARQAPLPMDSPGRNTGVSCHTLLQGIFQTQDLNPGLLHCRQILYQLKWSEVKVAQSCLTFQPHGLNSPWNSLGQNTGVGSLFPSPGYLPNPGGFFTSWATREAQEYRSG